MPLRGQDPGDTLTWTHDWSDFLAESETISSRVWTIVPDSSPSLLSSTTAAAVVVAGLTRGTTYLLTEQITTNLGNVKQKSLTLRCEQE